MSQYGEPWRSVIGPRSSNVMIFSNQELPGMFVAMTGTGPNDTQRKKIDRLVACVNACSGLSDETLAAANKGNVVLKPV